MTKQAIRVGDKVRFRIAKTPVVGTVREDHGPIGRGGRHLYGVVYEMGEGIWFTTAVPADEIEGIEPRKEPA